jgi:hypothetical protein
MRAHVLLGARAPALIAVGARAADTYARSYLRVRAQRFSGRCGIERPAGLQTLGTRATLNSDADPSRKERGH